MEKKNSKINNFFKKKKILFAAINCENSEEYTGRDLVPFFKEAFGKVTIFDLRKNYFLYGPDALNRRFLETLKKESPDYIFFIIGYDELYIETLEKIKKICPDCRTIVLWGDDDWRFYDWGRYYSLFFDYNLTTEKEHSFYKKDGIKSIFFWQGVNTKLFRPINIKKVYDTSFIGCPMLNRKDFVEFLADKKIKIKLFGGGWDNHSEVKEIYKGLLDSKEYVETINKTKVNLNFSKSFYPGKRDSQFKLRILEVFACRSFLLTEHYPRLKDYYKKNYDKISFKTKEELLKKLRYYLKNKKERDKLAKYFYNETIKNYSLDYRLNILLKILFKNKDIKPKKEFPKLKNKIIELNEKDFEKGMNHIKQKTKSFDYISFKKGKTSFSKYKNYLQTYSLEKSKKNISCCNYHLHSSNIGNYMLFMAKRAFEFIKDKQEFDNLLNINQIAVTKKFFFNNFKKFNEIILNNKKIDFIKNKNTVFISIPLVQIKDKVTFNYNSLPAFRMKFIDRMYASFNSKSFFFDKYLHNLLKEFLINRNFLVIKVLLKTIFNKQNLIRLRVLRKAIG